MISIDFEEAKIASAPSQLLKQQVLQKGNTGLSHAVLKALEGKQKEKDENAGHSQDEGQTAVPPEILALMVEAAIFSDDNPKIGFPVEYLSKKERQAARQQNMSKRK